MCSKEARGSRIGRHAAAHESQEDYAQEQCRERTHGAEPRVEIWSTMRKLNMSRGVAWMIKQSWNRKVMMWNTSRSITWMLISCLHLPHKERMRFACPHEEYWCFACHFWVISQMSATMQELFWEWLTMISLKKMYDYLWPTQRWCHISNFKCHGLISKYSV